MRESHAAQHIGRFCELDILVPDNLYAVAPRVPKIEKRSRQGLDAGIDQCFASGLFVIDDKPKMTSIVGGLCTALLQRNELVAQIDERHVIALAAKLEIEQPAIESQSRLDVTDLERDMIETDDARFGCFRHRALQHRTFASLCSSVAVGPVCAEKRQEQRERFEKLRRLVAELALRVAHRLIVGAPLELALERFRSELAVLETGVSGLYVRLAAQHRHLRVRVAEAQEWRAPGSRR